MKTKIIEIVLNITGLNYDAVMAKGRQREFYLTRSLIAYFLRYYTFYSLAEIGVIIGHRDHVTAMHSINCIQLIIDKQPPCRARTALIKGYIAEIDKNIKANIDRETIFCDVSTIEIKENSILDLWKLKVR